MTALMASELQRIGSSVSVVLEDKPVEIGQWFLARYGCEDVIGQCTDILPTGMVLRFRWGSPFRERHFVQYGRILGRVNDPRIFKF